jgi:hypothetical protein
MMALHTYSNGVICMDNRAYGHRMAHTFCALRESWDSRRYYENEIDAGYCIDAPVSMPAGSWENYSDAEASWESLAYRRDW